MSTKFIESEKKERRAILSRQLPDFVLLVKYWQLERIALAENNSNIEQSVKLLVGEISEVAEERNKIGSITYRPREEVSELIDVANFLVALEMMLNKKQREHSDFNQILSSANGQARKSSILDFMTEVAGNINEKNLKKDLQTFWVLLTSYFLNFETRIYPKNILLEKVIPKNNNNHDKDILSHNPLFKQFSGRDVSGMSSDEKEAYYIHYQRCARIIRKFYAQYIDPSSAEKGLPKGLIKQYAFYFYCFTSFGGIGIDSEKAQQLLREKLTVDYSDYLLNNYLS